MKYKIIQNLLGDWLYKTFWAGITKEEISYNEKSFTRKLMEN